MSCCQERNFPHVEGWPTEPHPPPLFIFTSKTRHGGRPQEATLATLHVIRIESTVLSGFNMAEDDDVVFELFLQEKYRR